jgi:hypothetical protein
MKLLHEGKRMIKNEDSTIKCTFCNAIIPVKTKVCPICKRKLFALKYQKVFLFFMAISITSGIAMSGVNMLVKKSVSDVNNPSLHISMDEFNQIETGMSYEQVKNLVGCEGRVMSTSSHPGYTITVYTWDGNGTYSYANVTFTNDAVDDKLQEGLK